MRTPDETRLDICFGIPTSRLAEICQAEREGRCVVLPCKVGDTVWAEGWEDGKYGEAVVYRVSHDFDKHITHIRYRPRIADASFVKIADGCRSGTFGKTVFLTRAEAEAALKELGVR